jgi:hypothetical protein
MNRPSFMGPSLLGRGFDAAFDMGILGRPFFWASSSRFLSAVILVDSIRPDVDPLWHARISLRLQIWLNRFSFPSMGKPSTCHGILMDSVSEVLYSVVDVCPMRAVPSMGHAQFSNGSMMLNFVVTLGRFPEAGGFLMLLFLPAMP